MNKRQWFLVAGLSVLSAACFPSEQPFEPSCSYNEETGDQFCYVRPQRLDPETSPTTLIDVPDGTADLRAKQFTAPRARRVRW